MSLRVVHPDRYQQQPPQQCCRLRVSTKLCRSNGSRRQRRPSTTSSVSVSVSVSSVSRMFLLFLQSALLVTLVVAKGTNGKPSSSSSSSSQQQLQLHTMTTTIGRSSTSKEEEEQQQLLLLLPVIGILSQPSKKHDHSYHYIATSYVDWIEGVDTSSSSDGYDDDDDTTSPHPPRAITIPIPYDASPELLDELFTHINGLLLPGGWNGYMPPSVPYLLDRIVESNANGIYFPVWGTCLGYEFLLQYIGGGRNAIQDGFDLYNASIPLEAVQQQELYQDLDIYNSVTNLPITLNNHQLGIEPTYFLQNPKLTAVWNITSINYDSNDRPFVSSIEPKHPLTFPFYGVQYHPEKNAHEYTTYPSSDVPYENIDHTPEGIQLSLHLSNFFLQKVLYGQSIQQQQQQQQQKQHVYTNKSRQQQHRFPSIRTYPTSIGIKYEDIYIIPYASHWETNTNTTTTTYHNNNNETMIHQQQQRQQQRGSNSSNSNNSKEAIINISRTGIIDLNMPQPPPELVDRVDTTITPKSSSSSSTSSSFSSSKRLQFVSTTAIPQVAS